MDRETAWKQIDKKTRTYERRYLRTVRALFREQRDRVFETAGVAKGLEEVFRINVTTENALFIKGLIGLYQDVLLEEGQDALDFLGLDQVYLVDRLAAQQFLLDCENKIKGINQTTNERLRGSLMRGVDAGESIDQLTERVNGVFDNAIGFRAETIARTETVKSFNFARHDGFKQSGVVEQEEWLATMDNRVRDTHAGASGQVKSINGTFNIGGAQLEYPGDPSGPAAEIINCRCSLLPVID